MVYPALDVYAQLTRLLLKLYHQAGRFLIGAVQRLHDFLKGEDYVDAVLLIQPVVFEGQAHTIQQYAIQHLGISGQIFELGVRKSAFGIR
mgnify:FL=1